MNKICPICELEMTPGEIVIGNINIRGVSGIRDSQWMSGPETSSFRMSKLLHLNCLRSRLIEFDEIPNIRVRSLLKFEGKDA